VATIRVHGADPTGLRRMARDVDQPADPELIAVRYDDPRRLATIVAMYGADVEVLSPPEAREAAARRLTALAEWSTARLTARHGARP